MDNLNTHTPGLFYETFQPDKAKALLDRFGFVYTPTRELGKHGLDRFECAHRAMPE
jgi:hypothetical protein